MNKKKTAQAAKDTDIKTIEEARDHLPEVDDNSPAVPVETKPPTTEQRLALIERQLTQADQNFKTISEFLTKIEPLAGLAQQLQERQNQPTTQETPATPAGLPKGFDIGSILQVLGPILGQVQGSSPLGDELMKKVIEAGLSQMTAGTQLLGAVQKKILMDMGTKIAQNIDTTAT